MLHNIRFVACLLASAWLPLSAAHPDLPVSNVISDRFRPSLPDQQKFAGLFAQRMRANGEGFLEHIEDKVLNPASRTNIGAFLEAAVTCYEYSHDLQLKGLISRLAKDLVASSGAYTNKPAETAWGADDFWRLRSDVLGLGAYYRLTHDEDAFALLRKLGGAALKSFADQRLTKDLPLEVLIEPAACLYRYTGDERYLSFARALAESVLQAQASPSFVPTYENLTGLTGLVDLYRLTGDASYLHTASGAWTKFQNTSISITGSPDLNGAPADACETTAWMQLTIGLLRVGGDAQYADAVERTTYNQLFAGQDLTSGAIFAAPPVNGQKVVAPFTGRCLANQALGVALIPSAVWGRFGKGIQVNLYGAGRDTVPLRRRGPVQLYSEASFPDSGDILLHVEPGRPLQFPLRLHVPEWASTFTVDVGGSHLFGKPGTFLTLNRQWNRGDTVRISMEMSVRVLASGSPVPGEIALQRGPQVLAFGSKYNPEVSDFSAASLDASDAANPKLQTVDAKLPSTWSGDQAYTAPGKYRGQPRQFVLTPFADSVTYRVWMKRSTANPRTID